MPTITSKTALILFSVIIAIMLAQVGWWMIFLNQVEDEITEMAHQYGADKSDIELIHEKERARQTMIWMEGGFFFILILICFWIIYQSFRKSLELKFHQQNFLMAVTHELKTPLASLNIYLDSLESVKIPSEKKPRIINNMREDAKRLEHLVENILDAGRFDRLEDNLILDCFDISELIKERMEYFKKQPFDSHPEIHCSIEDNVKTLGDSRALGRAIDAILENSLKYVDSAQPVISIELASQEKYLVLKISDNGIGISRENIKKIFDRFYRAGDEMTRRTTGTGLGLYLCREIIKAHGGKVSAFSDGSGKGAVFTIKLKRDRNHENSIAG